MSTAKRKGSSAESAVRDYFREHGWPAAERIPAGAALDRGDISGLPFIAEVKNQARQELALWLNEADDEAANAGDEVGGVVIHKRKGTTDVGRWYVTMSVAKLVDLLGP